MKLIDVGVCVNNIDPKGLGRIRYRPYGVFVSEIERAISYEDWDERDPFIALPFLPLHINIIPQIQQSVKLIKYNTEQESINVEYISGPYTSPHDLQNQTFSSQHKDTTFGGVIIKGLKDIRNKDGSFNSPVTKGTMIADKDTGFRGNYGSDIIFTENGVQIRGGLLVNKQSNKINVLDYPQLSKKMGRLSLKKFNRTYQSAKELTNVTKETISKIRYIVEYEINSLSAPTELRLYVYKIINPYGTEFNTNVFNETTVFPTENTKLVKLINTTGGTTNPTYILSLNGTIQSAYIELRDLLYSIDFDNLTRLDPSYPNEDIHPFFFRPTANFRITKGSSLIEQTNKTLFLRNVQLRGKSGGSSLIYSRQSSDAPSVTIKKEKNISKEVKGAGEQSFGFFSADKIYITSTSPNIGVNIKAINFSDIDEYEPTQDDYITKIEPNTYAMVRGETLYNFLVAIVELFGSHIHNINEPLVKTDKNWTILTELANTLRNDLLNDSIRIN